MCNATYSNNLYFNASTNGNAGPDAGHPLSSTFPGVHTSTWPGYPSLNFVAPNVRDIEREMETEVERETERDREGERERESERERERETESIER